MAATFGWLGGNAESIFGWQCKERVPLLPACTQNTPPGKAAALQPHQRHLHAAADMTVLRLPWTAPRELRPGSAESHLQCMQISSTTPSQHPLLSMPHITAAAPGVLRIADTRLRALKGLGKTMTGTLTPCAMGRRCLTQRPGHGPARDRASEASTAPQQGGPCLRMAAGRAW